MGRVGWLSLVALAVVAGGCSGGDGATADAGDSTASDTDAADATDVAGSPREQLVACVNEVAPESLADFMLFETDDGLSIGVARTIIDAPSVGETFPLGLARFAVSDGEDVQCVRDAGALDYTFGHHNWDEWGSAVVGDVRYELRLRYLATRDTTWTDTLSAYDVAGGQARFEDAALTAIDCWTKPPGDLNFCVRRPRSGEHE